MYAVYALVDPRDNLPFYIGLTQDVYARFLQHLRLDGSNARKDARIQELREQNLMVVMQTLQQVPTITQGRVRESYWMQHYLSLGVPLLNNHITSSLQYRVQTNSPEFLRTSGANEELIKNMLLDGLSMRAVIKAHWGVSAGSGYMRASAELLDVLRRLIKCPPSDMNGNATYIYDLLKQGLSLKQIIKEVWGVTSGNPYTLAAHELSKIIATMI